MASRYLVPKGYDGITVFPFIILRTGSMRSNADLINHERIHLRQQAEMLVVFFFVWYFVEFVFRLVVKRSYHQAYRAISFEVEAYQNEKDPDYLKSRPFWKFMNYLN